MTKQLCQQNNSKWYWIINKQIMGNLSIEVPSNRSPFARRPIFQNNNKDHSFVSTRSLSPYYIKSPKTNACRSSYYNQYDHQKYSKIFQSKTSNRVYLSPRMLKSVIKNSSNCQNYSPSPFKNQNKYKICDKSQICSMKKSFKTNTNLNTDTSRYIQKPFRISPSKQSSIKHLKLDEKQNTQQLFCDQCSFHKIQTPQPFTLSSTYNKTPLSVSKAGKSPQNSSRNNGIQPYVLSSHKCCCHDKQISYSRQIMQREHYLQDNAPTQRKKPVRVFEHSKIIFRQSLLDKKQINNKYVHENSEQVTIRNNDNMGCLSNIHRQNRQKCKQIIKRVRNFNQFLNQIKKKIKKQTNKLSSQNITISSMSMQQQQQQNNTSQNVSIDKCNDSIVSQFNQQLNLHKKSITIALRLQNQKIQLQKYRKMVERQLSKQHSIQSIQIQGRKNKQSLITINFDNKNKSQPQIIKKAIDNSNASQKSKLTQKSMVYSKLEVQEPTKNKTKESEKNMSLRVNKISKLMNKIQGMQSNLSDENYKEICQILQKQKQLKSQDEF